MNQSTMPRPTELPQGHGGKDAVVTCRRHWLRHHLRSITFLFTEIRNEKIIHTTALKKMGKFIWAQFSIQMPCIYAHLARTFIDVSCMNIFTFIRRFTCFMTLQSLRRVAENKSNGRMKRFTREVFP